MTLSVLDESGFKVLGVDMLRRNTMQAGDGGETLARTLNDLRLLAQAASVSDASRLALADPSAGVSPRPWHIEFLESARQIRVQDANRRMVGERTFPKSTSEESLNRIFRTMSRAVRRVNRMDLADGAGT